MKEITITLKLKTTEDFKVKNWTLFLIFLGAKFVLFNHITQLCTLTANIGLLYNIALSS